MWQSRKRDPQQETEVHTIALFFFVLLDHTLETPFAKEETFSSKMFNQFHLFTTVILVRMMPKLG